MGEGQAVSWELSENSGMAGAGVLGEILGAYARMGRAEVCRPVALGAFSPLKVRAELDHTQQVARWGLSRAHCGGPCPAWPAVAALWPLGPVQGSWTRLLWAGEGAARCSSHATGQVREGPEHPTGLGVGKGGAGASANSLSHLTRIQGALRCAQHGARCWGHSGEQDG